MSPVASKMMFEMMLLGVDGYKGTASGVGMELDRLCRAQITPSQMVIGRDTLRLSASHPARVEIGLIWDTTLPATDPDCPGAEAQLQRLSRNPNMGSGIVSDRRDTATSLKYRYRQLLNAWSDIEAPKQGIL
jgi:hypothetical protein